MSLSTLFSFGKKKKPEKNEDTTYFSKEKLPEVGKVQSEVLQVAVHQLKTPLVGMKWSLKMLLDEEPGPLNRSQRSLLERAYDSNENVINAVDNILHAGRVEGKDMIFSFLNANVAAILENKIYALKENAEQKNIKIKFSSGNYIPEAYVDASKISTVFQVLIENAIIYTEPEGIIKIHIDADDENIIVTVEDNGIGIPEDKQNNIFTKYFRSPNAYSAYVDGSGLGLYISKEIIEKHNGKIWFKSKEGKGTKFFVSIPIHHTQRRDF